MKVSLNWIKEFTDIPLGVDELVQRIGTRLGSVDSVTELGRNYQGIVIVRVVRCDPHPNADKLHVCWVNDDQKTPNVERDDDGLVQVVCGAPNVREGVVAAWLPPGTTVPASVDKEPFVLEVREIRGVKSNGMLASAKELAFNDDHSGLLLLDDDIEPGTSFAEYFKLDDYIIDLENKMFTHRPDCFGIIGVARELAGISGIQFTSPAWYLEAEREVLEATPQDPLALKVDNQLPELTPRFMAVALRDVTIKPSPLRVQSYLSRVGIRPINNVVDVTNFMMMLTAQPLHAYDYDKVLAQDEGASEASLVVRHPNEGEKLTLLNGKEITPREGAICIASATKLIGLAGVMGGADTEVDEDTKNIILECATFNMYSIRRTSMTHGIFSDAVTRYNKGQSPLQNDRITAHTITKLHELAGATAASPVIDDFPDQPSAVSLTIKNDFIATRLGKDLTVPTMVELLTHVEFDCQADNDSLRLTVPFWRTDVVIPEDVVEEIGRLYGYDQLPVHLPKRDIAPAALNTELALLTKVRAILAAAGANELLNYSFVHGNLLDRVGQNKDKALQLSNALSPELQYYRLSLTPSLLEKVQPNLRADLVRNDDNEFALFEINKVHNTDDRGEDNLPTENRRVALVYAADQKTAQRNHSGAPYFTAKEYLSTLLVKLEKDSQKLYFTKLSETELPPSTALREMIRPYEPKRSALITDTDGTVWGVVGEFTRGTQKALKLPPFAAGFELELARSWMSPMLLLTRKHHVSQKLCRILV